MQVPHEQSKVIETLHPKVFLYKVEILLKQSMKNIVSSKRTIKSYRNITSKSIFYKVEILLKQSMKNIVSSK